MGNLTEEERRSAKSSFVFRCQRCSVRWWRGRGRPPGSPLSARSPPVRGPRRR